MNASSGNLLLIGADSDSDVDDKEDEASDIIHKPVIQHVQSKPSQPPNKQKNVDTKKYSSPYTGQGTRVKDQSDVESPPRKNQRNVNEKVTSEYAKSDVAGQRKRAQSKHELPYTDTIKVNQVDLCLLERFKFGEDMDNCDLEYDTETGSVTIHSTDEDTCMAIKLSILEKLNTIVRQRCKISQNVTTVLKKDNGQSYLQKKLTQMKDAYVYLSTNEDGDYLCTAAFSESVAEDAIESVKSEIRTENIPFTDGHIHFIVSGGWEALKTEVVNESLVDVDISMTSKQVIIEGIGMDVKNSAARIKAVLQKKSDNKPLALPGGLGRCFLSCTEIQVELEQLKTQIRQSDGHLEVHSQDGVVTLTMSGVDTNKEKEVRRLTQRIVQGKIDIKKIITSRSEKDEDKVLLCRCLQSTKGTELMRRFERDNNIGVDIITTDTILEEARSASRSLDDVSSASSSDPESDHEELEYAIQVGRVVITVKRGNIVDEKAQVLVNFMEESSLWRYGALAKQFLKQGGDEMREEFDDAYDGSSLVVPTKSTGRLKHKCNHVCHVVVPKWKGDASKENLDTAMGELYTTVNKLQASSVSMSAVGTGKIMRYPGRVVADSLVRAAVKVAQERNKLQAITFVIFEEKDVAKFIEKLKSCHSELQETKRPLSFFFGPRSREIPGPSHRAKRKDTSAKQQKRPSSETEVSDHATGSVKMVEVVLYAPSKKQLDKKTELLTKEMRDVCLMQETIKLKTNKVPGETRKLILSQGRDKCVQIKIVAGDNKISIKGEKEDLLIAANEIRKILLNQQQDESSADGRSRGGTWKPRHHKGSEKYWDELSKNHTTAPYWRKFKAGAYIGSLMSKFKGTERCVVYQVDSRSRSVIEDLLTKTWNSTLVGQGRDAVGLSHQNISVTNVERIENLDLREKYLLERNTLIRKLQDSGSRCFDALEQISGSKGEILTTKMMDKLLKNDMHPEINEHYLLHGTKAEYVENIAHKGVDHKKGNDHVMFGSGIYCAESSTKADQYADDKAKRSTKGLKMLLVRLLMGEIYLTDQPNAFKHPPCTSCLSEKCIDATHVNFDSVVADGKWLFREFIVYDAVKCLPEYIITYDRV